MTRAKTLTPAERGQRGGRARSRAKTSAARANGQKGGRPRQYPTAEELRALLDEFTRTMQGEARA